MSIQFRSRIKPAINYADILNSYGVCCGITGLTGIPKSFMECFNEGGYYIPMTNGEQQVTCPNVDRELGCCCSCSYVSPSERSSAVEDYTTGVRSGVTRCECERRGGLWKPYVDGVECDSTNSTTYCLNNGQDVREPKSCCHLEFDATTGWPTRITCKDVCTSYDCALLGTETYPSIFGTTRCITQGSVVNCGSTLNFPYIVDRTTTIDTTTGSCYTLQITGGQAEYDCALSSKTDCAGYWVAPTSEIQSLCLSSFKPQNPVYSGSYYYPPSMSGASFDALGITTGDEFQGGIYIGKFKPNPNNPQSSIVRGNITLSGSPTSARFEADAIGGTGKEWAIIADTINIANRVAFLEPGEVEPFGESLNTSLWDGFYNTYGNNTTYFGIGNSISKTLKNYIRKGFVDWYIPSVYEMNFLAEMLYNKSNNTIGGNFITSSIFNTKYVNSSTNTNRINDSLFVYGQSILNTGSENYSNLLIESHSVQKIILFRRINLY